MNVLAIHTQRQAILKASVALRGLDESWAKEELAKLPVRLEELESEERRAEYKEEIEMAKEKKVSAAEIAEKIARTVKVIPKEEKSEVEKKVAKTAEKKEKKPSGRGAAIAAMAGVVSHLKAGTKIAAKDLLAKAGANIGCYTATSIRVAVEQRLLKKISRGIYEIVGK